MTEVTFNSSTSWTVPAGVTSVDVFLVGGGAGGNGANGAFCGGAGGYTATHLALSVTPAESIAITVGAGGAAANGAYDSSHEGGYSQFRNSSYRANGATVVSTKAGGSGGGGFTDTKAGGSDGGNGTGTNFGTGQGTTTRKFGEGGATLYAGGGGGPGGSGGAGGGGDGSASPVAGTANTGGGGGAHSGAFPGAAGGTGIVIVRYSLGTTLSETVTLTESLLKQGQKVLSDAISAADTILKKATKVLSENPTIADVFTGLRIKIAILTELLYMRDKPNIYNGDFGSQPPFTAETTTTTDFRWINGTTSGSTTDSSWGWGNIKTTNGNIATRFDTVAGRACITLVVTALAKSGGTVGAVGINNIAAYTGGTLNADRRPYLIPVLPSTQYTISGDYYLHSVSDAVHIQSAIVPIFYDSTFTRITSPGATAINNSNIATWTTLQYTITSPAGAVYVALGPRCTAIGTDSSGNAMTVSWTNVTITLNAITVNGLLASINRTLSEIATLTDTVPRAIQRLLSEAATITDSLLKLPGKILSEAVTLADTFLRLIVRTLSETATLTGSLFKSAARTLSQTLPLTDTFTRVITYVRTFTESLTVTEFIRTYLNGLNSRYSRKYEDQGTTYAEKYPAKGTQYEKKYPS